MQPACVLLVEDDVHTRRIVTAALSSRGIRVVEAVDGFEALRLAPEARPDLVVMDVSLPGMSGIETMRRLRLDLPSPSPPVLILTARAMRDDFEAARAAGCDAYLSKPIDPFDLADEVERMIAGRRGA